MKQDKFAAAINCIDGRAQLPVIDWLRLHCNVDYVDLITEPGADKHLAEGSPDVIVIIKNKLQFALEAHGPAAIAVVGHHDCLANPVSKEEHWAQISRAVNVLGSWRVMVRTVGLYVNEWRSVDVVCDTQ